MSYQISFLVVMDKQLRWHEDNDYNAERSKVVTCGIRTDLELYKHLLFE